MSSRTLKGNRFSLIALFKFSAPALKKEFYGPTPTMVFSGIKSAKIDNSTAIISVLSKGYFEQFSAPVLNTIVERHREARPFLGLTSAILTAGLFPVFAHKDFSEITFGCTDREALWYSENDITKKIKTGKSEWRDSQNTYHFLVSGFDKDYERDGYHHTSQGVDIDLSKAILNTDLTKKTTLKITCLDCDLLGPEEQSLFKDAKKTVEITADFREIQAALVAEEKAQRIEQTQRDKESAIQRAIDAKEDLHRRKEAQGVPLSGFKAQCKVLGFKEGTQDFGNCVLELNEAK